MRLHSGVTTELDVLEVGHVPALEQRSLVLDDGRQLPVHPVHVHDLHTLAELLEQQRWDIVVTEAKPDGLDPIEVVRCVKSRRPDCPVVMVARPDQLGRVLEARKEGLDAYVARPADEDVFRGLLDDTLRRALESRWDDEEAFLDSLRRKVLHNVAEDPCFLFSPDRRLLDFNAAADELAVEVRGEHLHRGDPGGELVTASGRSLLDESFRRALQGEESQFRRNITELGRPELWWEYRLAPVYDDAGQFAAVCIKLRDISSQYHSENALKQSKLLKQTILDTAVDAIVSIDEQGIVQTFNQAAEETFGYDREEVIGESVNMLMPAPHRDRHDHYIQRYLETGQRHIIGMRREVEGQRKDGTIFPLGLGVGEALIDGGHLFTAVMRDLSEKKAMERQLHQAEKMQAVGQLAGGVAHDFNNVLTIVNSYSDLLTYKLEADSELSGFVKKIQSAVWRGERLTRQLLAFSPQEVGEPEILDLNKIVTEMERFFGRAIEEDINVELDLDCDLGAVEADPGQIEQILMNLVVNARDAMPQGGELRIRTRDERIGKKETPRALRSGRYAVLEVEDSGVGMREETQARIFEPFFTTKAKGKGTGLGLATVYGIAHRYDGYVSVDSELGRGTRFRVYLPVTADEQMLDEPDGAVDRARDRVADETILLVEDEDDIREPLRYTLEDGGYTVLEAADGDEALRLGREHSEPIDLLLTDVVLPGASGVELAEKLCEARPKLKVIFISGYAGDALERKNLQPGRVLISKPFDIDRLIHTVREMLES